jgi:hypothetical protein
MSISNLSDLFQMRTIKDQEEMSLVNLPAIKPGGGSAPREPQRPVLGGYCYCIHGHGSFSSYRRQPRLPQSTTREKRRLQGPYIAHYLMSTAQQQTTTTTTKLLKFPLQQSIRQEEKEKNSSSYNHSLPISLPKNPPEILSTRNNSR